MHRHVMDRSSLHEAELSRLKVFLAERLPENDFGELHVEQFTHGQSNPTFLIASSRGAPVVLRKQPRGPLLKGAHDVAREFQVMRKLYGIVPVPKARILCEDPSILGTPFFVYDYEEGRLFRDIHLPEAASNEERTGIYASLARTLARCVVS